MYRAVIVPKSATLKGLIKDKKGHNLALAYDDTYDTVHFYEPFVSAKVVGRYLCKFDKPQNNDERYVNECFDSLGWRLDGKKLVVVKVVI